MITIESKWGAMYLVTDESYTVDPVTLISPEGITLSPGEKVSQIGKIKRTSFEMNDGFTMQYEGLLKVKTITYAIFKSSGFDKGGDDLFTANLTYRYAFAVVFVRGKFECFYIDTGIGGADIRMDFKR